MANEIKIIFPDAGQGDFTAFVYTSDCVLRYSDVVLADTGHDGLYSNAADVPLLVPGDVVVIKKGAAIYDGFEYMPEALSKLAADGWDALAITEPSGDPAGWSVPQKLLWLVMRFLNQHSSDNFNGIVVRKTDGSVATGQTVIETGGVKTVGMAQ
jgi:hypothetical protein